MIRYREEMALRQEFDMSLAARLTAALGAPLALLPCAPGGRSDGGVLERANSRRSLRVGARAERAGARDVLRLDQSTRAGDDILFEFDLRL